MGGLELKQSNTADPRMKVFPSKKRPLEKTKDFLTVVAAETLLIGVKSCSMCLSKL
jgi:hypothetical protein